MTEFADAELRKAREALSDAKKLREADGSTPGVVNRVFFVAFHAARAVLSVRGTLPDDEDHVPAQFAEDVVIAEETSMEDAQFLNGLRVATGRRPTTNTSPMTVTSTPGSSASSGSSTIWQRSADRPFSS